MLTLSDLWFIAVVVSALALAALIASDWRVAADRVQQAGTTADCTATAHDGTGAWLAAGGTCAPANDTDVEYAGDPPSVLTVSSTHGPHPYQSPAAVHEHLVARMDALVFACRVAHGPPVVAGAMLDMAAIRSARPRRPTESPHAAHRIERLPVREFQITAHRFLGPPLARHAGVRPDRDPPVGERSPTRWALPSRC